MDGTISIKTNPLRNFNMGNSEIRHTNIKALVDTEMSYLNWLNVRKISYDNMVRIRTPMDGSCFFHALAKAYCESYINGMSGHVAVSQRAFVMGLRKDLSVKLGLPVDPRDPNSPRYYDLISRGNLAEYSKGVPQYSLEGLQNELLHGVNVDFIYNEFIGNEINKDIYILHYETQDIYIVGNDMDLYYKGRDSVVILWVASCGHYELVGIEEEGIIKTLFDTNHNFIVCLKNRIEELIRLRVKV